MERNFRKKGFTVVIPKDKTIQDFIEETNKHKISDEFLKECEEAAKLFDRK